MTEIEKKFIACLIKQKVTSFKMSLCQHSEVQSLTAFLLEFECDRCLMVFVV